MFKQSLVVIPVFLCAVVFGGCASNDRVRSVPDAPEAAIPLSVPASEIVSASRTEAYSTTMVALGHLASAVHSAGAARELSLYREIPGPAPDFDFQSLPQIGRTYTSSDSSTGAVVTVYQDNSFEAKLPSNAGTFGRVLKTERSQIRDFDEIHGTAFVIKTERKFWQYWDDRESAQGRSRTWEREISLNRVYEKLK